MLAWGHITTGTYLRAITLTNLIYIVRVIQSRGMRQVERWGR